MTSTNPPTLTNQLGTLANKLFTTTSASEFASLLEEFRAAVHDQVLTEAAVKLREMAQAAPRSRRAGCLSFASGVLEGMAAGAHPLRPVIDRALERDHSMCGVEPCSDCR